MNSNELELLVNIAYFSNADKERVAEQYGLMCAINPALAYKRTLEYIKITLGKEDDS